MRIPNEDDLAKAIQHKQPEIEISGILAGVVVKIKATGSIAWAVFFAAIIAAIFLKLSGVGAPAAIPLAGAAVGALGAASTASAIKLGVAAGSPGVLRSLREEYDVVSQTSESVVLRRKAGLGCS